MFASEKGLVLTRELTGQGLGTRELLVIPSYQTSRSNCSGTSYVNVDYAAKKPRHFANLYLTHCIVMIFLLVHICLPILQSNGNFQMCINSSQDCQEVLHLL